MSDTTPTAGQALATKWIERCVYAFGKGADRELAADIDAALAQARREGAEAMRARIVDITRERAKAMAPVGRAVLGTMAGLIEVLDAPPAPADSAQRGDAA